MATPGEADVESGGGGAFHPPREHLFAGDAGSLPALPEHIAKLDPAELTTRVLDAARVLGFALVGVAHAAPSERAAELRTWLAAGMHGTMGFMAADEAIRANPATLTPWARCFLAVGDMYASRNDDANEPDPAIGRVARYAHGKDYHEVVRKRLHALADRFRTELPGSKFRTCVDTVPVPERELAARAGLGWQGKNTMLIYPRVGSYFVLGVVATNLPLIATPAHERVPDSCGSCTRCIDACPTGAITPYRVDGSRCISYLTIEQRGLVDETLHAGMGDWLFGCDVCQEVCPHNSPRREQTLPVPHASHAPRAGGFDLLAVLGWTPEDRQRELSGSAMKRATLAMLRRNAVIAAGNALRGGALAPGVAAALRARIARASADANEPKIVRAAARSVLASHEAQA